MKNGKFRAEARENKNFLSVQSRVDVVQRQCATPSLSMKLEFDNLEARFRRRSNNFASEIDAPLGQLRMLGANFRRCF